MGAFHLVQMNHLILKCSYNGHLYLLMSIKWTLINLKNYKPHKP